jgi:hypothetical protein
MIRIRRGAARPKPRLNKNTAGQEPAPRVKPRIRTGSIDRARYFRPAVSWLARAIFWVVVPIAGIGLAILPSVVRPTPFHADSFGFVVHMVDSDRSVPLSLDNYYRVGLSVYVRESITLSVEPSEERIDSIDVYVQYGSNGVHPWKCFLTSEPVDPPVDSRELEDFAQLTLPSRTGTGNLTVDDPVTYATTSMTSVDLAAKLEANGKPVDGISCDREVASNVLTAPYPGVGAPSLSVVVPSASTLTFSYLVSMGFPANWGYWDVNPQLEPDRLGALTLESAPEEFVDEPSDYPGPTLPNQNAREVTAVFSNPAAIQELNNLTQFGLLLLGAWLGIVGGILQPFFTSKRQFGKPASDSETSPEIKSRRT